MAELTRLSDEDTQLVLGHLKKTMDHRYKMLMATIPLTGLTTKYINSDESEEHIRVREVPKAKHFSTLTETWEGVVDEWTSMLEDETRVLKIIYDSEIARDRARLDE